MIKLTCYSREKDTKQWKEVPVKTRLTSNFRSGIVVNRLLIIRPKIFREIDSTEM